MRGLVVAFVICGVGTARADYADNVATYEGIDRASVREATTYRLPEGSEYADLIVARYVTKLSDQIYTTVILERCTTKHCTAELVWLNPHETIEVLGIVDLAGASGPFPDRVVQPRRGDATALTAPARVVHPALVLRHSESKTTTGLTISMRHVTGTEIHESITVLSLAHDCVSPTVFSISVRDHYPGGGGQDTSLRFDRAGAAGLLSIIATQQMHIDDELACIPPKPTETRWRLEGDRYTASALTARGGCR